MKIVYMGTPEFAVPCLKALLDNNYEVAAVFTQPDRAKGRGNKLTPPPVKILAESAGIPVYQPEKIKTPESVEILRQLAPDLIIVVAFGQLLSKAILDIPQLGCVNVHASLLPKYRGAAPINWCIINGEKTTGVTTMYMDVGLDTGDMILKSEIEIGNEETADQLHDRLSVLGAETLIKTVKQIEQGIAPRTPQDSEKSTYAPIMAKTLGKVDWSKDAASIVNLIRGTYPWPGAFSSYQGKSFKIFRAEISECKIAQGLEPGTIVEVNKDSIIVSCGSGSIRILELQFENEKRMTVDSYLRGHEIDKNTRLGG